MKNLKRSELPKPTLSLYFAVSLLLWNNEFFFPWAVAACKQLQCYIAPGCFNLKRIQFLIRHTSVPSERNTV